GPRPRDPGVRVRSRARRGRQRVAPAQPLTARTPLGPTSPFSEASPPMQQGTTSNPRGRNVVVVGTQWGDEGKGKVVDWLTDHAEGVVRFQGGHNAGHTLVIKGVKTALQ